MSFKVTVYNYICANFATRPFTSADLIHLYKGETRPMSAVATVLSHFSKDGFIFKSEKVKQGAKKLILWRVDLGKVPNLGAGARPKTTESRTSQKEGAYNLAHAFGGIAGFDFWNHRPVNARIYCE